MAFLFEIADAKTIEPVLREVLRKQRLWTMQLERRCGKRETARQSPALSPCAEMRAGNVLEVAAERCCARTDAAAQARSSACVRRLSVLSLFVSYTLVHHRSASSGRRQRFLILPVLFSLSLTSLWIALALTPLRATASPNTAERLR